MGSTVARLVKVSVYSDKGSPFSTMKGRIDTIYWTIIEMMTVIVCANLPAMPALLRYVSGNSAEVSPSSTYYSHDDNENADSSQASRSKLQSWYKGLTKSVHRHSLRIASKKSRSNESSILRTSMGDEKNANFHLNDYTNTTNLDDGPQVAAAVSTNEYDATNPTTSLPGVRMLSRNLSSSSAKSFSQADRKNNSKPPSNSRGGAFYRLDEVRVERSQSSPGIWESIV